jgi:serine/threonine protein phosphatase PrpC
MADETDGVRLLAYGTTHVGMVRTNNEDAYIIADLNAADGATVEWKEPRPVGDQGVLLAVSDGMGGAAAGEIASAITVESLRSWLGEEHGQRGTDELIEEAVVEANRNVFDAAQDAERQGMGATLTAMVVRGTFAYVAEVGDSRAYIIRNGRIRQVTRDQSYVQQLVDQGLITREQAEESPYKNVILQAMGQRAHVDVALCRVELRRDDHFLLCSDGLSGKVADRELHEAIAESESFEVACRRLINLANTRGGEDNITIVVAKVVGETLRAASNDEKITRTLSDLKIFGEPERMTPPPPPPEPAPGVASHVTQMLSVPPAAAAAAAPAPEPEPAPVPVASPFPAPAAAPVPAERSVPWMWIAVAVVVVLALVAAVVLLKE